MGSMVHCCDDSFPRCDHCPVYLMCRSGGSYVCGVGEGSGEYAG